MKFRGGIKLLLPLVLRRSEGRSEVSMVALRYSHEASNPYYLVIDGCRISRVGVYGSLSSALFAGYIKPRETQKDGPENGAWFFSLLYHNVLIHLTFHLF